MKRAKGVLWPIKDRAEERQPLEFEHAEAVNIFRALLRSLKFIVGLRSDPPGTVEPGESSLVVRITVVSGVCMCWQVGFSTFHISKTALISHPSGIPVNSLFPPQSSFGIIALQSCK